MRKGDSLSVIARRFGTSVAELRGANELTGDVIRIDQRLDLPAALSQLGESQLNEGPPAWQKPAPAAGLVLRPFGPYVERGVRLRRSGAELACPVGSVLHSPANGIVRHSSVVTGYGHLLIIEHPGAYATVLGPCDPAGLTVALGEAVLAGDVLGRTGEPAAAASAPYVHLELRHRDQAIAPDPLLR